MTMSPDKLRWAHAAITILIVVILQWFVVNVAVSIDSTAHISLSRKAQYGLRTAVLMEQLDGEAFVLVMLGMSAVPLLLALEFLAALAARRFRRPALQPPQPLPHTAILKANWMWLIYWPLWLIVFALAPSWPIMIGGILVVPPVMAIIIGIRNMRDSTEAAISKDLTEPRNSNS